ncbi:MAG: hypothetical protein J3R72DRAFT_516045 [Linnemannia gamsii]|nr:MAG: hypothetical protein J3R72DRAFT_516045 [Linnemannia gamsii]
MPPKREQGGYQRTSRSPPASIEPGQTIAETVSEQHPADDTAAPEEGSITLEQPHRDSTPATTSVSSTTGFSSTALAKTRVNPRSSSSPAPLVQSVSRIQLNAPSSHMQLQARRHTVPDTSSPGPSGPSSSVTVTKSPGTEGGGGTGAGQEPPSPRNHPAVRKIVKVEGPTHPPAAGPSRSNIEATGSSSLRDVVSLAVTDVVAGRKRVRFEEEVEEDEGDERDNGQEDGGQDEQEAAGAGFQEYGLFSLLGSYFSAGSDSRRSFMSGTSSSSGNTGGGAQDQDEAASYSSSAAGGCRLTSARSTRSGTRSSTTYAFYLPPGVDPAYPQGFSGHIDIPNTSLSTAGAQTINLATTAAGAATSSSPAEPSSNSTATTALVIPASGLQQPTATQPSDSSSAILNQAPPPPTPPPPPPPTATPSSILARRTRTPTDITQILSSLSTPGADGAGGDGDGDGGEGGPGSRATTFTIPSVTLPVPIRELRPGGEGGSVPASADSDGAGDGDGNKHTGVKEVGSSQPLQQALQQQEHRLELQQQQQRQQHEVQLRMTFQIGQNTDQIQRAALSDIEIQPLFKDQSSSVSVSGQLRVGVRGHRHKRQRINWREMMTDVAGTVSSATAMGLALWMIFSEEGRHFRDGFGYFIRFKLQELMWGIPDCQLPEATPSLPPI